MTWQTEQDLKCSGCGKRRDESFDPDGPDYDAVLLLCRACEARDKASARIRDGGHAEGMHIGLEETPASERILDTDLL